MPPLSAEAELKESVTIARELKHRLPFWYPHEALKVNDPSGLVRLPTLLHPFAHEDAQDPSECKLSVTPKYPEENLPLSHDLWGCI